MEKNGTKSYKKKLKNKFDDVYDIVKLIPKGRVSTYGTIAAYLGMKSGARFVGWAMNAAHSYPEIPAHRVVNRNGLLTGKFHFEHPNKMQELLEEEGVQVEKDKVSYFDTLFWDPSKELL